MYYASITFGCLYLLNISIETTFSKAPYNFTTIEVGLSYIPASVGYLLASLFGGRWTDKIMAREARRAKRYDEKGKLIYRPADRMRENAWIAAFLYPCALIWYGWTAEKGDLLGRTRKPLISLLTLSRRSSIAHLPQEHQSLPPLYHRSLTLSQETSINNTEPPPPSYPPIPRPQTNIPPAPRELLLRHRQHAHLRRLHNHAHGIHAPPRLRRRGRQQFRAEHLFQRRRYRRGASDPGYW